MTLEPPTEPPVSGPAVEQPPHGTAERPKTTVYKRGQHALWIYWPNAWVHAWVMARQDFASGAVVFQVELPLPEGSYGLRAFAWGPDNVRSAEDDA